MLVLHPSSRCDVCLDSYEDDAPDRTPYAIPCGHTFCKACIECVSPPTCPLCRKTFLTGRAKKLHVDHPENLEDHKEIDLLQRLVLSWEEPEENQVEVATEVETWLQNRHDEASIPLRRARGALANYQLLKTTGEQDQRKVRQLEETLEEIRHSALQDRLNARAVEENFQASIIRLESQVAQFESETTQLKSELSKYQQYKHTRNPLPPPPEPVPFDLPSFRTAQFLDNIQPGYPGYPLAPITNGASAELYPNGYAPARYGEKNASNENQHRSRRSKAPYDIYAPNGHSNGADVSVQPQRGIIPGASPNRRVIPAMDQPMEISGSSTPLRIDRRHTPSPPIDPVRDGVDPYTVTGAYLEQYVDGWNEGYQAAFPLTTAPPIPSGRSSTRPNTVASSTSSGVYDMGPLANSLLDRVQSEQQQHWVQRPTSEQLRAERAERRRQRHRSGERPTLHESQSELSVAPSSSTRSRESDESNHRRHLNRRTTSQVDGREHVTVAEFLNAPDTSRVPRADRPSTSRNQDANATMATGGTNGASVSRRLTRDSTSSWGTVSSGVPDWQSSGQGSLTDLGLRTFSGRAALAAASSSDTSLPFSANPFPSRVNEEDANPDMRTPMVYSMEPTWPATAPPSVGFNGVPSAPSSGRNSRPSESRYNGFPSTPAMRILAAPQGSLHTQAIVISEEEAQRSSRPRRSRRESSRHARSRPSTSASNIISEYVDAPLRSAPATTSESSYTSDGPMPLSEGGFGNALGLDLALEHRRTPQISAPTPRVSSHAFLRSFSYDQYS